MSKLKDEHKPLLNRIAAYVSMAIAAIGFATAYFFYSAQAGLLLEAQVKSNDAKTELHAEQSTKQFGDMNEKLDKIIQWQIDKGR